MRNYVSQILTRKKICDIKKDMNESLEKATAGIVVKIRKMARAMPKEYSGNIEEREGRVNAYGLLALSLANEFANRVDSKEGLKDLTTHSLLDTIMSLLKAIHEETVSLLEIPIRSYTFTEKDAQTKKTYRLEQRLPKGDGNEKAQNVNEDEV